jgi:hypothetical protein
MSAQSAVTPEGKQPYAAQVQSGRRTDCAELDEHRLEQQVGRKSMRRSAAKHQRECRDPSESIGGNLVQEKLEDPGIRGLEGGARNDHDVAALHRGDRFRHGGMTELQQSRPEFDQVQHDLRVCPRELSHQQCRGLKRA